MKIRTVAGFLVAPLAIPILVPPIVLLVQRAVNAQASGLPLAFRLREALSLALMATLVAYIVIAAAAVPVHIFLARRRRRRLRTYVLLGAALGAAAPVLAAPFERSAIIIALFAMGLLSGAAAAALFWLIAVRRVEPDKPEV